MAGNNERLNIEITGSSDKAVKAAKSALNAIDKLDKKGKQTSGKGGGMGMLQTAFKRLAAYGAAGIVINGVQRFLGDSLKMAASLEGIERQFKLATSQGETSLSKLREATKGTVSDFELMKAAVRADTFGLPLKKMAGLFEFATLRAAQTGDSVQYLTESIVLGLGRKSPLILDNLGITMIRLKEAMGGTVKATTTSVELMEAMIKVAEQDTKIIRMLGEDSLTTSQKIDKLNASIDSMKASLGKGIIQSDVGQDVSGTMEGLSEAVSALSDQDNGFLKQLRIIALTLSGNSSAAEEYAKAIQGAKAQQEDMAASSAEYAKKLNELVPETQGVVKSTDELESVLSKASPVLEQWKSSVRGGGFAYNQLKAALNAWAMAQKEAIEGTKESRKELATLTDINLKYGDALKILSYQLKWNSEKTNELKEREKALLAVLLSLEQAEVSSAKAIAEKSRLLSIYGKEIDVVREKLLKLKQADELKDALGKIMFPELDTTFPDISGQVKRARMEMEGMEQAAKWLKETNGGDSHFGDILPEGTNDKFQEMRTLMSSIQGAFNGMALSGKKFGEVMEEIFKRLLIELATLVTMSAIFALLTGGGSAGSFGNVFKSLAGIGEGGGGGNGIAGSLLGLLSKKTINTPSGTSVASSAMRNINAGSINVNVTGEMRGNDMYLTSQRGKNFISKRLG